MKKYELKVNKNDDLISYLNKNANLSKNTIHMMLRKKDIKVNNIRQTKNIDIFSGDIITYFSKEQNLNIIFENDDFIVIDKNYNIEVVGDDSIEKILNSKKINSNTKITKYIPVHRLDRNTTGLVLFAKNENYANYLKNLFKEKKVSKKYLAIVVGKTNFNNFSAPLYLFCDKKKNLSIVSNEKSKGFRQIHQTINTIENFKVNDTFLSLIDINLISGKTHQIRASMKYLEFPILGDGKYGNNRVNKEFGVNYQLLNSNEICFDNFCFKSNFDLKDYVLKHLN